MTRFRVGALTVALGGLLVAIAPAAAQHRGGHGDSFGHGSFSHGGFRGSHMTSRGGSHGIVGLHRFRSGRHRHTSVYFGGLFGSPWGYPYGSGYYGRGYPYDAYYGAYPYDRRYYRRYRRCHTEWVWDDYEGTEVPVRVCRRR